MPQPKIFKAPAILPNPIHKDLKKVGQRFWKEFGKAVSLAIAPWWSELMLQHFPDRIPSSAYLIVSFSWNPSSHYKLWVQIGFDDRECIIKGHSGLNRRKLYWTRAAGKRLRIVWESFFKNHLSISTGSCGLIKVSRPSKSLIAKSNISWGPIEHAHANNQARFAQLRGIRRKAEIRGIQYLHSLWPILEQRAECNISQLSISLSSTRITIFLYSDRGINGVQHINHERIRNFWKPSSRIHIPLLTSPNINKMFKLLEIPQCNDSTCLGSFDVFPPSAHEIANAKIAIRNKLK